jgi:hypothetical protein
MKIELGTSIVQQIKNVLAAIYDPADDPDGTWRGADPIHQMPGVVSPVRVKGMPDWLVTAIEDMIEGHEDKFRELLAEQRGARPRRLQRRESRRLSPRKPSCLMMNCLACFAENAVTPGSGPRTGSYACPVCGLYDGDHHLASMEEIPVQVDDWGDAWGALKYRAKKARSISANNFGANSAPDQTAQQMEKQNGF